MTTSHQQRPLTLNTQSQKSDIDNLLIHLTVKERERVRINVMSYSVVQTVQDLTVVRIN